MSIWHGPCAGCLSAASPRRLHRLACHTAFGRLRCSHPSAESVWLHRFHTLTGIFLRCPMAGERTTTATRPAHLAFAALMHPPQRRCPELRALSAPVPLLPLTNPS